MMIGWRSRWRGEGTADEPAISRPSRWMMAAAVVAAVAIAVLLIAMAIWAKGFVLNGS